MGQRLHCLGAELSHCFPSLLQNVFHIVILSVLNYILGVTFDLFNFCLMFYFASLFSQTVESLFLFAHAFNGGVNPG